MLSQGAGRSPLCRHKCERDPEHVQIHCGNVSGPVPTPCLWLFEALHTYNSNHICTHRAFPGATIRLFNTFMNNFYFLSGNIMKTIHGVNLDSGHRIKVFKYILPCFGDWNKQVLNRKEKLFLNATVQFMNWFYDIFAHNYFSFRLCFIIRIYYLGEILIDMKNTGLLCYLHTWQ